MSSQLVVSSLLLFILSTSATPISPKNDGHEDSSSGKKRDDLLSSYQLVWSDDFDGDDLDVTKWYPLIDCSGRGNHELQCYTNLTRNIHVEDGLLHLTAYPEKYMNNSFTSGRVHAVGAGWKFGFFEARARLPKGKHLWPAIWMVPTSPTYGPWPMSGEIDIMEYRGQTPTSFQSTIHFGATRQDRGKMGTPMIDVGFDFSKEFHVFGFEWTNQSMTWYLDGVRYLHLSTDRLFVTDKGSTIYNKTGSPFDHNFKWILNVAVGGSYFPKSIFGDLTVKEALKWPKPSMEVDWVRVYKSTTKDYVDEPEGMITEKGFNTISDQETSTILTGITITSTTSTTTVIPEKNSTTKADDEDKNEVVYDYESDPDLTTTYYYY